MTRELRELLRAALDQHQRRVRDADRRREVQAVRWRGSYAPRKGRRATGPAPLDQP